MNPFDRQLVPSRRPGAAELLERGCIREKVAGDAAGALEHYEAVLELARDGRATPAVRSSALRRVAVLRRALGLAPSLEPVPSGWPDPLAAPRLAAETTAPPLPGRLGLSVLARTLVSDSVPAAAEATTTQAGPGWVERARAWLGFRGLLEFVARPHEEAGSRESLRALGRPFGRLKRLLATTTSIELLLETQSRRTHSRPERPQELYIAALTAEKAAGDLQLAATRYREVVQLDSARGGIATRLSQRARLRLELCRTRALWGRDREI